MLKKRTEFRKNLHHISFQENRRPYFLCRRAMQKNMGHRFCIFSAKGTHIWKDEASLQEEVNCGDVILNSFPYKEKDLGGRFDFPNSVPSKDNLFPPLNEIIRRFYRESSITPQASTTIIFVRNRMSMFYQNQKFGHLIGPPNHSNDVLAEYSNCSGSHQYSNNLQPKLAC